MIRRNSLSECVTRALQPLSSLESLGMLEFARRPHLRSGRCWGVIEKREYLVEAWNFIYLKLWITYLFLRSLYRIMKSIGFLRSSSVTSLKSVSTYKI